LPGRKNWGGGQSNKSSYKFCRERVGKGHRGKKKRCVGERPVKPSPGEGMKKAIKKLEERTRKFQRSGPNSRGNAKCGVKEPGDLNTAKAKKKKRKRKKNQKETRAKKDNTRSQWEGVPHKKKAKPKE